MSNETLAVFGGTFNPVHQAHLILAERVSEALSGARILFVPAGDPPHKEGRRIAPGTHRLAMVRRAIRGNPRFRATDLEIARAGRSYTIDSLRVLRERCPDGTPIVLILGADQALEFETWREYERIVREFSLVITTRAGSALDPAQLCPALKDVPTIEIPAMEISSTEIRRRVSEGRSIRYLVPPSVERYIREQDLYRERESAGREKNHRHG